MMVAYALDVFEKLRTVSVILAVLCGVVSVFAILFGRVGTIGMMESEKRMWRKMESVSMTMLAWLLLLWLLTPTREFIKENITNATTEDSTIIVFESESKSETK